MSRREKTRAGTGLSPASAGREHTDCGCLLPARAFGDLIRHFLLPEGLATSGQLAPLRQKSEQSPYYLWLCWPGVCMAVRLQQLGVQLFCQGGYCR